MTKPTDPKPDYNQLTAELDELLARLESGDLDVDQAVECYERGTQIITTLQKQLDKAENRVNTVHDNLGGGQD